jgi:histidine triad (HIT) family protein
MYDQDNIFAKILRGEIPAATVYEDEHALSFMDAMPQADGHTLVIPKTAARNLFDISPQALAELVKATQHVARGVQHAFQPAGMRIIQFNEPAAGQTVFHIHFHIVPCYEGEATRAHGRDWADKAVLAQHAERIRAALATLPRQPQ